jgi:2-desacetyl-2-hydroxyethyl bacteriochlorophyllide A dehydrogenase
MKLLKYIGPKKMEIQEVECPKPQESEVLLKVRACGICGSDVHGYLGLTGRRIPPMVMGHEFSAEIYELGKGVKNHKTGEGVIVQPINFCGTCVNCIQGLTNMCLNKKFFGVLDVNGALSEYISVPEKLIYKLPANCSFYEGALAEPYAVAYGSTKKAGQLKDKTVLIIGAGTIGLCILQLVRLQNPSLIIVMDLSDVRLQKAKELHADVIINSKTADYFSEINKLTDGRMVDVSIEAVGIEDTANKSIKCLKVGGKSIWVGMSQTIMKINMQDIVCPARSVIGSFNYTHKEFGEMVGLMQTGNMQMSKMITKVVALSEAEKAFNELLQYPDKFLKIIVDPTK